MKKTMSFLLISLSIIFLNIAQASRIKGDETVLFFPGNAYLKGGTWVVPVHGWIFEQEEGSRWRRKMLDSLPSLLEIEPNDSNRAIYEQRTRMFLVDNEHRKKIEVEMLGKRFTMKPSQDNGHFYGEFHIANNGQKSWQTFQAVTQKNDPRLFEGKAQFIPHEGISVISDIDDTIKISNVKDKQALLKNTFFKAFEAVPEMAAVYQAWQKQGAVFHYLSASPWHLYPALSEFITASGFPEGSYNLKNFRVKDQSFFNLFSSQSEYKKPILEALFKKYPKRQFILVGDAGEEDPEIFATLARLYPKQVLHIFIRDLNLKENQLRYQETFKGIPAERWSIFRDGHQLLDFKFN
ncbi:MAG: DUF2183 domain-containing protein [Methyloprofundus sp.]|nr:DUF2183 domain-containing protein [Methyloprofundus sp.]